VTLGLNVQCPLTTHVGTDSFAFLIIADSISQFAYQFADWAHLCIFLSVSQLTPFACLLISRRTDSVSYETLSVGEL